MQSGLRVGCIGINHKQADLHLREQVATLLSRHFSENGKAIVLNTCNRTEVYFSSEDLTETHHAVLKCLPFDENILQRFYSFFGVDCFEHLARVTSGLDSAIVGESEIQGQVKAVYEQARKASLPSHLHRLFQWSLRIGKKVRTALPLHPSMPDTGSIIFEQIERFFTLESAKTLFVGASEINLRVLQQLKRRGLQSASVINRSAVGKDWSVDLLPWHQLDRWHEFDVVIFGTKYPGFLLGTEWLKDLLPTLLIDLSVPRNVDPLLARHPNIYLHNIEQIHMEVEKRRKFKVDTVKKLDKMIAQSVEKLSERAKQSNLVYPHFRTQGSL